MAGDVLGAIVRTGNDKTCHRHRDEHLQSRPCWASFSAERNEETCQHREATPWKPQELVTGLGQQPSFGSYIRIALLEPANASPTVSQGKRRWSKRRERDGVHTLYVMLG